MATNTSGPGRFGHGTFRDYVIGVTGIDGRGRLFSGGGRVVKNVAGYDLCKLLIGSLGTLAVISEVTLKLRPAPETRRAVWLTAASTGAAEAALARLTSTATRPVAIELLNAAAAQAILAESKAALPVQARNLCVVFEGGERECQWQSATLQDELRTVGAAAVELLDANAAAAAWKALVEFQAAGDDPLTFAIAVPASRVCELLEAATDREVAVQAHAGNGIVIGHLPDRCATPQAAAEIVRPLRRQAESYGGSLVIWNADDAWKDTCDVFGGPRPDVRWMQRVKQALDPDGLLSPGRFPW